MLISSKGKGYKARTCGFDLFFHYSHHGAFTLEGCTVVVRMFYDPTTRCNVDVCNLGRIGNNNEHRNDLIQVKRGIVVADPLYDQSPISRRESLTFISKILPQVGNKHIKLLNNSIPLLHMLLENPLHTSS